MAPRRRFPPEHPHDTALPRTPHAADQVGSKLCCEESPLQVSVAKQWVRANYTITGEQLVVTLPAGAEAPVAVRYAWEAWPQCSFYNGVGGPDNHTGIAMTPWCWDGTKPCAY